jgi:hypothetical protein
MSRASELADWLDRCKLPYDPQDVSDCAAELRRLERVNAELVEANEAQKNEWLAWDAKRQRLERKAARFDWAFIRSPEWTYAVCKWDGSDWLPINTQSDLDEMDAALTSATKEQQK